MVYIATSSLTTLPELELLTEVCRAKNEAGSMWKPGGRDGHSPRLPPEEHMKILYI
jgi:hypothetical protein